MRKEISSKFNDIELAHFFDQIENNPVFGPQRNFSFLSLSSHMSKICSRKVSFQEIEMLVSENYDVDQLEDDYLSNIEEDYYLPFDIYVEFKNEEKTKNEIKKKQK